MSSSVLWYSKHHAMTKVDLKVIGDTYNLIESHSHAFKHLLNIFDGFLLGLLL